MLSVLWSAARLHRCIMELRDGKFVAFWFDCLYSCFFWYCFFHFFCVFFMTSCWWFCFMFYFIFPWGFMIQLDEFLKPLPRWFRQVDICRYCMFELALSTGTRFVSTVCYSRDKVFPVYSMGTRCYGEVLNISETWWNGSAGLGICIHKHGHLRIPPQSHPSKKQGPNKALLRETNG